MQNIIITILLWLLIGFGFLGGLNVSYLNFIEQQACPNVSGIAICYLVTVAYGLMFASLFIQKAMLRNSLFFPAWSVTFLIALTGTGFELTKGDICPKTTSSIPHCFVSLAMCLVIMMLFMLSLFRKNNTMEMNM